MKEISFSAKSWHWRLATVYGRMWYDRKWARTGKVLYDGDICRYMKNVFIGFLGALLITVVAGFLAAMLGDAVAWNLVHFMYDNAPEPSCMAVYGTMMGGLAIMVGCGHLFIKYAAPIIAGGINAIANLLIFLISGVLNLWHKFVKTIHDVPESNSFVKQAVMKLKNKTCIKIKVIDIKE